MQSSDLKAAAQSSSSTSASSRCHVSDSCTVSVCDVAAIVAAVSAKQQ
jgi:hypothetical protein